MTLSGTRITAKFISTGKALLTIPALEGHLRTFFGEGEVLSALTQPECLLTHQTFLDFLPLVRRQGTFQTQGD